MSAGGKAESGDVIGVNAEFLGVVAHVFNGGQSLAQGLGEHSTVVLDGIHQHERADALRRQAKRDRLSLVAGKTRVASAGEDDDCGTLVKIRGYFTGIDRHVTVQRNGKSVQLYFFFKIFHFLSFHLTDKHVRNTYNQLYIFLSSKSTKSWKNWLNHLK